MKICRSCKEVKIFELFGRLKSSVDGYRIDCKECRKIYSNKNKIKIKEYKQKYYILNKEKSNENSKNWYIENIDSKKEYDKNYALLNKDRRSEYSKKWRLDNIENVREYKREYYNTVVTKDINKMLKLTVRSMIKRSITHKISKTNEILGCSYEFFKNYIESKFEDWMCWDNRGLYNGELNYGWDIDHIIPISSGETEEYILKLNHYTNLQPLCSKVNRDIKRDKLDFNF